MAAGETRSQARTWLYIGLAFLGFWVVYLTFFMPGNRPALDSSGAGRVAEYDWSLQDLQKQPVRFSTYRGKTVFLNVWATWCPPCIREMPSIAKLAAEPRLQGKNIEFVCIAVDDAPETVRDYVRDKNWPMTVLHAGTLPPTFQTEGIPATFILSPQGKILTTEVGSNDWDRPETIELLEKAAASAAPAGKPGA